MSEHPNVVAARAGLDAFLKGDTGVLAAMLSDDIVWHGPGNNPYSGDSLGKEASLARMGRLAEDGVALSFDIHDIVGNDEHVVVICDATISKGGRSAAGRQVQVMHVSDRVMTEFWALNDDQAAVDAVLNS